jgi:hypothetical protein
MTAISAIDQGDSFAILDFGVMIKDMCLIFQPTDQSGREILVEE